MPFVEWYHKRWYFLRAISLYVQWCPLCQSVWMTFTYTSLHAQCCPLRGWPLYQSHTQVNMGAGLSHPPAFTPVWHEYFTTHKYRPTNCGLHLTMIGTRVQLRLLIRILIPGLYAGEILNIADHASLTYSQWMARILYRIFMTRLGARGRTESSLHSIVCAICYVLQQCCVNTVD